MSTAQPVTIVVGQASSQPVTGTFTISGESAVFTPQLGRDMYLTISGTWTGSVQLQRSTDGEATWNDTTIAGGLVWAYYTGNCDEVVATPTDKAAKYRLDITVSSGSMNIRIAQ